MRVFFIDVACLAMGSPRSVYCLNGVSTVGGQDQRSLVKSSDYDMWTTPCRFRGVLLSDFSAKERSYE